MRRAHILLLAGIAGLAMLTSGGRASAIEYPWCAEYGGGRGGASNCGFSTIEQCRAAIWGNGGFCRENLFYPGAYQGALAESAPPVVRPRKRVRDVR